MKQYSPVKRNIHKRTVVLTLVTALGVLMLSDAPAIAAPCTLGLPCITDRTPNDPADETDGPNISGSPNASKSTSAACDADFMNQIYARAWLEAKREDILKTIVVRKPDSVLEYTCFDQMADDVPNIAGGLFSASNDFENSDIGGEAIDAFIGEGNMDDFIENLVFGVLTNGSNGYIQGNFAHDFLGGQARGVNNSVVASLPTPTTFTETTVSIYACDQMATIYELSMCNNFAGEDQFFTFRQLNDFDPRADIYSSADPIPSACSGTNVTLDHVSVATTSTYVDTADAPHNNRYVNFDEADLALYDGGGARTLIDWEAIPTAAGSPEPCSAPPIPTGVSYIVEDVVFDTYGNATVTTTGPFNNNVCFTPSCHYDPVDDRCESY